jgi:hypothetical protein
MLAPGNTPGVFSYPDLSAPQNVKNKFGKILAYIIYFLLLCTIIKPKQNDKHRNKINVHFHDEQGLSNDL